MMKLTVPTPIQPLLGPSLKFDRIMPVPTVLVTPHSRMKAVMMRAASTCLLKLESRKMSSDTASFDPVKAMIERMSLARID